MLMRAGSKFIWRNISAPQGAESGLERDGFSPRLGTPVTKDGLGDLRALTDGRAATAQVCQRHGDEGFQRTVDEMADATRRAHY